MPGVRRSRSTPPRRGASNRASPKSKRKRPGGRARIEELQTERKCVTILRVDLQGSTDLVVGLELEESIDRLAPAMAAMRASVHTYGGIIHREMADGLFAVFGAPVAHDLHAVMGCLAALDLLRRIEALDDAGIRVRVGVHSGQVVAGSRRPDFATTYEFDGPPLILFLFSPTIPDVRRGAGVAAGGRATVTPWQALFAF